MMWCVWFCLALSKQNIKDVKITNAKRKEEADDRNRGLAMPGGGGGYCFGWGLLFPSGGYSIGHMLSAIDVDDEPIAKKPRFSIDADLKVAIGDTTFEVHSALLMLASPVFAQMLTNKMPQPSPSWHTGQSSKQFGMCSSCLLLAALLARLHVYKTKQRKGRSKQR